MTFFENLFLKYFDFYKCAQFLSALFIILVSLRMTLFSEKILISNRCISGLMPNLIKKSWTVSKLGNYYVLSWRVAGKGWTNISEKKRTKIYFFSKIVPLRKRKENCMCLMLYFTHFTLIHQFLNNTTM